MPVSSTSQQASTTQWQTRLVWLGWTAAATILAAGFWLHKLDNANQRALARRNSLSPAMEMPAPGKPLSPQFMTARFPQVNSAPSSPKN